ncbi:DNA repair protein RecN [Rubrivivax sp. A210]|uniref:DNA repair protein RecN n=1 Tax=Rubrivivax sp. A210 TaxID=2772301 RepID=UPI0019181EB6|nr:DNA repair protein RecN [Rubrivivax sp. A210]CAD5372120.1 DNA repair protein RecN [Rubrivivax sp. A210]
MLRRLTLRDVVIVAELEVDLGAGFTVLTGETGAGKSILVDALQLALGNRADAGLVREGAARAEVSAEFDTPPALRPWLDEAGFAADETLLLRRAVDAQGKSRAWINGSPATLAQLREASEHLVEIHGQHAWQSLTRPLAVRALLDAQAGADTAALAAAWQAWRQATARLEDARGRQETLARERERLAWQIAELDKLAPATGEWEQINAEHQRLAHGQALLDGARAARLAVSEDDDAATVKLARAIDALEAVQAYDAELGTVAEVLRAAQAQAEDAAHSLHAYLGRREPDPERLDALDQRLGQWVALARRYRRQPAELPALLEGWRSELAGIEASADLAALEAAAARAEAAWRKEAEVLSRLRRKAAPRLAAAVTQAMQQLGMAGGRFEVALLPQDTPQAFGLEAAEFRVAGHAGSTPRALAKVASGGELSRLALAIAVTTSGGGAAQTSTLIFDEIDAGVGGTVADSVGRLMKQLGGSSQVLAVTHLAQVAACADHHFLVSKALRGRQTVSDVRAVEGEARVGEIARMLGGETLSGTAHAQALLGTRSDGCR